MKKKIRMITYLRIHSFSYPFFNNILYHRFRSSHLSRPKWIVAHCSPRRGVQRFEQLPCVNSHGFILPNTDANSTAFDFLVAFCSFFVYSLVPGSSIRTFHKVRPSTDPDVRLSRIRLLIWLIVCLISVYPTLFSLKSVSSSCQSLCIGQVSFSDIATCSSLPSSGITHLQRYYGTIRLPIFLLSLFLLLTRHTLLLILKLRKYIMASD